MPKPTEAKQPIKWTYAAKQGEDNGNIYEDYADGTARRVATNVKPDDARLIVQVFTMREALSTIVDWLPKQACDANCNHPECIDIREMTIQAKAALEAING